MTNRQIFFAENVTYRHRAKPQIRSNQIKKVLHEILTKAIFEYEPCKQLLGVPMKMPDRGKWAKETNWFASNAEPFHNVSECTVVFHRFLLPDNFMYCRY